MFQVVVLKVTRKIFRITGLYKVGLLRPNPFISHSLYSFLVKQGMSFCYRAGGKFNLDFSVYFPILFRIFIVFHILNTPLFFIYTKRSNNQTLLDFLEVTVIYMCENVHCVSLT